jgi:hypothetical protein
MNRRLFLRNLGLAAGVLYIPDRFLLRAERHFEHHGDTYLKTFRSPDLTFQYDDWQTLHIGDPCQGPTDIPTWREFLTEYRGHEPHELTPEFIYEEWALEPADLEMVVPEDVYIDQYWLTNESSTASAWHFLEPLDIGPPLTDAKGEVMGELTFIEGPMPGNDSLLVQCDDGLGLSCLQWRLEQMGHRCNFERG